MTDNREFEGGYLPRRLARRKKRTGLVVLLSAIAVVVVAAVVASTYLGSLAQTFDNKTQVIAEAFPDEELRPVKNPEDGSLNFLLLGVDHGADGSETSDLLQGGGTDQRSDSMMLMHIPEDRKGVYVMSIVRDLYTDIPGYGRQKINASMALGGVPLVVQTIEGMLDTKIDHVAMIDFDGFKELTTALGGVTVRNDIEFYSTDNKKYFYPVGDVVLKGNQALRFVRERKPFVDGDYQRVKNQQKFIKAVMNGLLSKDTLTNPATVYEVIDKISPYLSLDDGFDAATAAGLGLQLKGLRASGIEMFTLPTAGSSTSPGGESIELRDEKAIVEIGKALRTDTLRAYLDSANLTH
ncbi:LytR family transcriptional regulator [Arthrobacter sp. AQ5-05]|uniref:LCP family protein n=1 Tax=Arthrobacter sp. AQ5-05 TaxID=2184581 RepID=UPI000DCE6EB7|nr:LCP family protein [Arthrobacter sp. AQ5-05]RAX48500.1 LytR family transcriptional regulator [Arthrobacter sp. AQ5-05]